MEPPYTNREGRFSRAMAITVPGMVLSQPPIPRMASIWWPADHQLDGVRDDLPAHEGALHPLVSHGFPVRDHERVELHGRAARFLERRLGNGGKVVQVDVAGRHLAPRGGDGDDGLVEVRVREADGAEHCPVGHAGNPLRHGAAVGVEGLSIGVSHGCLPVSRQTRGRTGCGRRLPGWPPRWQEALPWCPTSRRPGSSCRRPAW